MGEDAVDAKSSLYPALIASAMYETARLYKADKQNFTNIEEAAKSVANSMRDEDCKSNFMKFESTFLVSVKPRKEDESDQFESPFKRYGIYKTSHLTGTNRFQTLLDVLQFSAMITK